MGLQDILDPVESIFERQRSETPPEAPTATTSSCSSGAPTSRPSGGCASSGRSTAVAQAFELASNAVTVGGPSYLELPIGDQSESPAGIIPHDMAPSGCYGPYTAKP